MLSRVYHPRSAQNIRVTPVPIQLLCRDPLRSARLEAENEEENQDEDISKQRSQPAQPLERL